jgi:hypothetical protein
MPIVGRIGNIAAGAGYTTADVTVDRQSREQVLELLDLRFLVIRASHANDPASRYVLEVLEGCLERLPGDDRASGYRILRPCPPAGN